MHAHKCINFPVKCGDDIVEDYPAGRHMRITLISTRLYDAFKAMAFSSRRKSHVAENDTFSSRRLAA